MNQRKAKALRSASGFEVHAVREYETKVRKVDHERKPIAVQVFCTGARVAYQAMKKAVK
jgi:hypothetical protein